MRLSSYYLPTLKEDPAEAEVVSHRLLVRSGIIRKLTSGIYTFLPLGLRTLEKTAQVIRSEMNRSGCMEVLLPMVQPANLWEETGRWELYGKELLRLKDRHMRDYCLGPTHEEVITDIIRKEIRSYRQLPINLYQIQTKFRDEIRPRFGLMRCREFLMKDGYSFDRNHEECQKSYQNMFEAYNRIFNRLGLKFCAVEADTGPIGGSFSHEFMVLAETGEDKIAVCPNCQYAANMEKAEVIPDKRTVITSNCPEPVIVYTPRMHTVEAVSNFLQVPTKKIIKTLLYEADGKPIAALIPGDRELNEVKLKNYLGVNELHLASAEQILHWTNAPVGFSGPKDLSLETIIVDYNLQTDTDWVTGANQEDTHYLHIDLKRDVQITGYTDLVYIAANDPCPKCKQEYIHFHKGIEVGHVFQLGTKYSKAMQATYLDENGQRQEMFMGCYGIGVSRVLAATIEQNHDKDGIVFPPPISPFEVLIIILNINDQETAAQAEDLYKQIGSLGVDVLLDDREVRPGVKFKDADLVGLSMQLIIGDKGLKRGVIEAKDRRTNERKELPLSNFLQEFKKWREQVWQGWGLDISNSKI